MLTDCDIALTATLRRCPSKTLYLHLTCLSKKNYFDLKSGTVLLNTESLSRK